VTAGAGRARVHVWVRGRVQGVGFRFSACERAERLRLGGWVRNLGDGRVEAVFEGPAADVARAIEWCRRGPPGAWVSEVRSESESPIGESGFRTRPTAFRGDEP